ncbi:MAG: DUF3379 family protein [Woeseiaceae bacterium]|nr:DUF3379 family protein [Woeseiaceae bacterium]
MSEQTTDMNCTDYREAIAADPSGSFDGGREHAATCAECRAVGDGYRAFDNRIRDALEISVPELRLPDLPKPATGAGSVVDLAPRLRLRTPAWFGIAAGLALAAFVGLQAVRPDTSDLSLAEQVIAHLDHEEESRVVTDVAVPERTLNSVVGNDVAEMDAGIGLITYARTCIINGKAIPHLVIQGEKGPVTLLLLPDEPVERATPLEGASINGIILPVGSGSIAIVGERDEPLDKIEDRVVNSVKWKT